MVLKLPGAGQYFGAGLSYIVNLEIALELFAVVLFEDYCNTSPYTSTDILEKIVLPKYAGRDLSNLTYSSR